MPKGHPSGIRASSARDKHKTQVGAPKNNDHK